MCEWLTKCGLSRGTLVLIPGHWTRRRGRSPPLRVALPTHQSTPTHAMSAAPAAPAVAAPSADDALKLVTLAQVSEHAKKSDCWMAHNGKVYDVTAFLDDHPGGPEIMMEHAGAFARAGGLPGEEGDGPSARACGWQSAREFVVERALAVSSAVVPRHV